MAWSTPKQWEYGDTLLASDLNDIADNLRYLNSRPKNITRTLTGTTVQISSVTSWQQLYTASLILGDNVNCLFNLRFPYVASDTATRNLYLDILIDNNLYLSSLTSTPTSFGAYIVAFTQASQITPVAFTAIWASPPKGEHTFTVVGKISNSALIQYYAAGAEFSVMEI